MCYTFSSWMFCRFIALFTLNLIRTSSLCFKINLLFSVASSKENYKTHTKKKKHIAGVVETAAGSCTVLVTRNTRYVNQLPCKISSDCSLKCSFSLSSITERLVSTTWLSDISHSVVGLGGVLYAVTK